MHVIWNGSISFGLVNIPINLYNGTEDQEFHFNLLHKADHSPIRYVRVCKAEDKEVAYSEIVKGYEYEKEQYITLSAADFQKADMHGTHSIEVIEFVKQTEIDTRFFYKPYYLEPGKGADKAYVLLREAMKHSQKVAVTKIVLRNRQDLGIIKPLGEVLVLNVIRFAEELRDYKTLRLPDSQSIKKAEMEMALALINQLTHPFEPSQFKDTYTEKLRSLIEAKLKGKVIRTTGKAPKETKVKDLMATLKASLKRAKKPKIKSNARPKSRVSKRVA